MPRKQCKAALEIYKKFVAHMEIVAKFLAVAEVCTLTTAVLWLLLRLTLQYYVGFGYHVCDKPNCSW